MSKKEKETAQKPFRSLTFKVATAFLGVSIALLVLSTAVEFLFSFEAHRQIISKEQNIIAQDAGNAVSNFMAEKFRILNQADSINYLVGSADRRTLVLNKLLGNNPAYRQLFLIDSSGTELRKASRLSLLLPDPLNSLKSSVLAETMAGKNYISRIYIDPETSEPLLLIAVPGRDIYRQPIGAFAAEVSLKFMWNLVSSLKVGQTGSTYVVDKQGYLIAFKDTSRVLAHENVSSLNMVREFLASASPTVSDARISSGIQDATVLTSRIDLGTPDWSVVVEEPVTEAYAATFQELWFSLGIILFGALFAVMIGMYLSRKITQGIVVLSSAAENIANGDLNAKIEIESSDEIGRLAGSFNAMTAKLRDFYEDLEAKVQARTEELVDEESKLKMLVKALPVGVAVVRASDGKATLVNEKGTELLGKGMDPNGDLSNASEIYRIVREDGSPYPTEDLPPNVALRTGMPAESHDMFIQRDANTRIAIKSVASPLKDATGKIVSVVIVFDDITKEQEIDKAKTEFVSLASHQLRTPLSTINWYTEMLMAGDAGAVNENQKKFLGEIYLGSTRMVELVNALLNVSRLELGTFVIEPAPTDMIMLARSVMDEQKPQLDDRKQTLVPKLDKDLPIMEVDPKLMRMVFQNFLSNAIKYTPEGGRIELSLSLDREKKSMLLSVSDNGYGITKSQQDKIFSKLFRADNVKAKDTVGTGLGLYIVKSIVEHSDGKVWFESEENKGTTFYVSLPLSGMKKKTGDKALS